MMRHIRRNLAGHTVRQQKFGQRFYAGRHRSGRLLTDADEAAGAVGQMIAYLHRIHALRHAVEHLVPAKGIAEQFFAGDAV